MALVHGRIGGQKIQVFPAFRVPDAATMGPADYHRNRMVILGTVGLFKVQGLRSGYGVVGHGELG